MKRAGQTAIVVVGLCLLAAGEARADAYGTTQSGNWSAVTWNDFWTPSNPPGSPPPANGPGINDIANVSGGATVTYDAGASGQLDGLYINYGGDPGPATVIVTSPLTLGGSGFNGGGGGTLNVDGTTLTVNSNQVFPGVVNITNGGIVNTQGFYFDTASQIALGSTSQFNVVTNAWATFRGGSYTLDFVNTPAGGKFSIPSDYGQGSTIYLSGEFGVASTLNMGSGSDGLKIDFIGVDGGIKNQLNITGATVTVGAYGLSVGGDGGTAGNGASLLYKQANGQTTGLTVEGGYYGLTIGAGGVLALEFDAASASGDWVFKLKEASDSLTAMVTDGLITVSGAAYQIVNDGTYTTIEAIASAALHPGDANGDTVVDLQDFGALKDNFGLTSGATWAQGDFNGDGAIDLQDFGILKDHFGHTDGDSPVTAVPEPGTLAMLLGLGALFRRRASR